jgi:hypothetical protein
VDAELARLVRRGGDHLAGLARIARAADHHGEPPELGVAPYLDRGEELIHVDVQDPPTAHRRLLGVDTPGVSQSPEQVLDHGR